MVEETIGGGEVGGLMWKRRGVWKNVLWMGETYT